MERASSEIQGYALGNIPVNINTLFDVDRLDRYIRDGYISARRHPHLPLTIYNYTAKTQWENFWDEVTKHCRGLIVDWRGEIVGNCLVKFFNHNEPNAQDIDTSGSVQVTDKLDGSYLAVCIYDGEVVTATRGSFESDQALAADKIIAATPEYQATLHLLGADSTAIFEVIFPENRIVLDYGGLRDIVLIGTIANFELANGKQLWTPAAKLNWPGRVVRTFECETFAEALAMPPRDNAEGIVVYFENTGERVKIKQQRYLELHKLIFDLTPKRIWERRMAGETLVDILEGLPDEFHTAVFTFNAELEARLQTIIKSVEVSYAKVLDKLNSNSQWMRKDFAAATIGEPYTRMLFQLLDGNSAGLLESAWKLVKPTKETL
jgi:RNA ligase